MSDAVVWVKPKTLDPSNNWLLEHKRIENSQHGEDGILEKIFELIGTENKVCCEFGAWDGIHLSNVYHLVKTHGWKPVMIEADREKFVDLETNYADIPGAVLINEFVNLEGEGTLDSMLARAGAPTDLDLLSIDVDSFDYHIWNGLNDFRPRVVVIEHNPAVPEDVFFVQPADTGVRQGASLLALSELGKAKGYELVCVTGTNGIFVREEFFPRFEIADNSPPAMFASPYRTYLVQGYDGMLYVAGCNKLMWRGKKVIPNRKVQVLPEHKQALSNQ